MSLAAFCASEAGLPHSCRAWVMVERGRSFLHPPFNLYKPPNSAAMADSDSSLSTPPATDDEMAVDVAPAKAIKPLPQKKKKKQKKKNGTILSFFEKEPPSPPRKKRAPSPPHEPAPEDNFDIAVRI